MWTYWQIGWVSNKKHIVFFHIWKQINHMVLGTFFAVVWWISSSHSFELESYLSTSIHHIIAELINNRVKFLIGWDLYFSYDYISLPFIWWGPESVYQAYRWYRTNHLSLDKLRFKTMIFFLSGLLVNLTILSYDLATLSIVPGSVNMLSYFIGQIIFESQIEIQRYAFFFV